MVSSGSWGRLIKVKVPKIAVSKTFLFEITARLFTSQRSSAYFPVS
jgi:hypothetical protein